MKIRSVFYFFILVIIFTSCQKNNLSNVPYISLKYFGYDTIRIKYDTLFLDFLLTDGDGDLGNDPNSNPKKYDIYIKDFRFDTGYAGYYFPQIDKSIEIPSKGISGSCLFEFYSPDILNLRTDSIHTKFGDTTHFEFYIMDRAGHQSNHLITPTVYMIP